MSQKVVFARSAAHRCIAGSPSRRPGNFLLRGQKKVTKEEALNRTPARSRQERRAKTPGGLAPRRDPLRSRCCPCDEPSRPLTPAARRAHQEYEVSVARATRHGVHKLGTCIEESLGFSSITPTYVLMHAVKL